MGFLLDKEVGLFVRYLTCKNLIWYKVMGWVMMFNAIFNNISVISWLSVLLVEETGIPQKKTPTCHKSLTNYHIMLYRVHIALAGFELTTSVAIGTEYTGSCKFKYHTIMTTTAPTKFCFTVFFIIFYDVCWYLKWCYKSWTIEITPLVATIMLLLYNNSVINSMYKWKNNICQVISSHTGLEIKDFLFVPLFCKGHL